MSNAKKKSPSPRPRLVRCTVCSCLVPKSSTVEVYSEPVCTTCDGEMVERDNELYERDMQEEIHRLWGYGQ